MRYLWFISILLVLESCSSRFPFESYDRSNATVKSDTIALFWKTGSSSDSTFKFLANATIYGKEIKGILILRKMSDSLYKASFLAQGAAKLFDLEIMPDTFKVYYSIKQLNKQAVLRTLANDIRLITIETHKTVINSTTRFDKKNKLEVSQVALKNGFMYYGQDTLMNLSQLVQTNFKNKEDVSVILSNYRNHIPHNILLMHHRFRMQIDLSLMVD
jgi:hypothetical protein